jgi:hypothetical protein
MTINHNDTIYPPFPCTPFFFNNDNDLFVLSNETIISDLSIFKGLRGLAKQIPEDTLFKKYSHFQMKWKNSTEYKTFPYEFTKLLKITLSHIPEDWLVNRDILDKEVGYFNRIKYIGQHPKVDS